MNLDLEESIELAKSISKNIENKELNSNNVKVIVSPNLIALSSVVNELKNTEIQVSSQNIYHKESGAYTGEVSAKMVKSAGVNTVIIGHSERRAIFGDSDQEVKSKVNSAISNGMDIIFCIGETLEQRKSKKEFDIIKAQLEQGLLHLSTEQMKSIVIAYEPVWAIGTGETASDSQAQEMHKYIRTVIKDSYNEKTSENTHILYGGSVKPSNAKGLFACSDIDGALIGGASLKADVFCEIINIAL